MTYSIHPILVHFPIALLVVYSGIKILPLSRWFPLVAWTHIERALLLVGVLGAFASLSSGESAEHLTTASHQLVETHAFFASAATWLYGILLAGEVLTVLNPWFLPRLNIQFVSRLFTWLQRVITRPFLSKLIAFLALIAIALTGLLGGVMVYGVTADPLAPFVLKLLNITL